MPESLTCGVRGQERRWVSLGGNVRLPSRLRGPRPGPSSSSLTRQGRPVFGTPNLSSRHQWSYCPMRRDVVPTPGRRVTPPSTIFLDFFLLSSSSSPLSFLSPSSLLPFPSPPLCSLGCKRDKELKKVRGEEVLREGLVETDSKRKKTLQSVTEKKSRFNDRTQIFSIYIYAVYVLYIYKYICSIYTLYIYKYIYK